MKIRSHGIVVGYHRDDNERWTKVPPADIHAGNCVSCGCNVFLNINGVSAVKERDADCICRRCDKMFGTEVDRSLIES
jgi:hypothetical protein